MKTQTMKNKQKIDLMQIKIESLESRIKKLKSFIDKYYSLASCKFVVEGKDLTLFETILYLVDKSKEIEE